MAVAGLARLLYSVHVQCTCTCKYPVWIIECLRCSFTEIELIPQPLLWFPWFLLSLSFSWRFSLATILTLHEQQLHVHVHVLCTLYVNLEWLNLLWWPLCLAYQPTTVHTDIGFQRPDLHILSWWFCNKRMHLKTNVHGIHVQICTCTSFLSGSPCSSSSSLSLSLDSAPSSWSSCLLASSLSLWRRLLSIEKWIASWSITGIYKYWRCIKFCVKSIMWQRAKRRRKEDRETSGFSPG